MADFNQQKEAARLLEDAIAHNLTVTQAQEPRITDGVVLSAMASLLGKVIRVQNMSRATKEKLALTIYKTVQQEAGLLEHGGKFDG